MQAKFNLIFVTNLLFWSLSVNASEDPLAVRGTLEDALTSQLLAVSLVTNDLEKSRAFYEKGMGLVCQEFSISDQQKSLWSLSTDDWQLHRCQRPATQGGVEVRIISSDSVGREIRDDFSASRNGILSMGFAIDGIEKHKESMQVLGYPTNDGVTTITLPTTSGGSYTVKETHYRGPHNSYNLGIERPEGFATIADIDAATGLGGPAYSGMIASDPDQFKQFMETVLGFEARRDIKFESSGPGGGLIGVAKGTKVRFVQMYSPGSSTAYIIVMGMGENGLPSTATPKLPNAGLVMWSFTSAKFDEVLARAREAKLNNIIVSNRAEGRAMTFEAPNGVLMEVIEKHRSSLKGKGSDDVTSAVAPISEPVSCAKDAPPALLMVEGDNVDTAKFKAYSDALQEAQIYEKLDGYYMTVGDPTELLEGEWKDRHFTVVARFPCKQRAHQFWYSETYESIKVLREGAGDVRVVVYEELAKPKRIDWVQ